MTGYFLLKFETFKTDINLCCRKRVRRRNISEVKVFAIFNPYFVHDAVPESLCDL